MPDSNTTTSKTTNEYRLCEVIHVYTSFRTVKFYKPCVKGVYANVSPDHEFGHKNPIRLAKMARETLSQSAKIALIGMRHNHLTDIQPWRDEACGSVTLWPMSDSKYKQPVYVTFGGKRADSDRKEDYELVYPAIFLPVVDQEAVQEVADFFLKFGKERHMGICWNTFTGIDFDSDKYTKDDITQDLQTLASADRRYASVIDLPGIFTTADAEFDRAMIYLSVEEAKNRLRSVGLLPEIKAVA